MHKNKKEMFKLRSDTKKSTELKESFDQKVFDVQIKLD